MQRILLTGRRPMASSHSGTYFNQPASNWQSSPSSRDDRYRQLATPFIGPAADLKAAAEDLKRRRGFVGAI